MSVSVAGRLVQSVEVLSSLGRLSLAFVDGGLEWLAWAVADLDVHHEFPDETALADQVQRSLHGSPFALLPALQLMVSPVKLMTLGLADLRLLARAEGGDTSAVVEAQVRKILAEQRLVTQAELASGPALLAALDIAASPLFQAMDFDSGLALSQLATETPPAASLRREAAVFAVAQARTPQEFCDHYRVFLDLAAPRVSASLEQREAAATATLQVLRPQLFGALDGPRIHGLPSPRDVDAVVGDWLSQGRQVGFARLSLAVQQIVRHAACQGETGDGVLQVVRPYLQSAKDFLAAGHVSTGRMGQDGATCSFLREAGHLQAELQVNDRGFISLGHFQAGQVAPGDRPQAWVQSTLR